MPILVLKTQGGITYPLSNGKSLQLRGFGLINKVSAEEWKECKEKHKGAIEQLTSEGFLIVSDVENSATKNATNDLKQKVLDKQTKDIESNTQDIVINNKKAGKVSIKKG